MHVQQHNSSGWHKNNWNLLREEAVYLACMCNSTTVQDDTKTTGICSVKKLYIWHACATAQQFRTTQNHQNQLCEEAVNWACKWNNLGWIYTTGISSVKKLSIGPARVKQHNSVGRHNTQLESAQWRSCQHITYWLTPLHQQCPAIISMALIFVKKYIFSCKLYCFQSKSPSPFSWKAKKIEQQ